MQLKRLREQADLSQREVARRINKTPAAYNFYELGKRQPDLETLVKLADIFEVSTDVLLDHIPARQSGNSIDITPDERSLLKLFRKLDMGSRQSLHDYMNFLYSRQQEEQGKREDAV